MAYGPCRLPLNKVLINSPLRSPRTAVMLDISGYRISSYAPMFYQSQNAVTAPANTSFCHFVFLLSAPTTIFSS